MQEEQGGLTFPLCLHQPGTGTTLLQLLLSVPLGYSQVYPLVILPEVPQSEVSLPLWEAL